MDKYRISIEYCVPWNYLPRAVGLTDELLNNYQHVIEELELITSTGGAFEVMINDELVFSKKTKQKRHAEPGEILAMFRQIVSPEVTTFPQNGWFSSTNREFESILTNIGPWQLFGCRGSS